VIILADVNVQNGKFALLMMFTLMDVQFCLVIFHSLCASFCKTLDISAYISDFCEVMIKLTSVDILNVDMDITWERAEELTSDKVEWC